MRRRLAVLAVVVLLATLGVAAPADAGPSVNVITATGVQPNADTNCGTGSRFQIMGDATGGGVPAGNAREKGHSSTLLVDEMLPFDQGSNYSGAFDLSYGVPTDVQQAPGTIIGLWAAVGDGDDDPATFGEWFLLYRCADDGVSSEVIYDCTGALGTCPTTAGEYQEEIFGVETSNPGPSAGDTVTATAGDCLGDAGALALLEDGGLVLDEVLDLAVVDGGFSADFVIPADAAPGSTFTVVADCALEGASLATAETDLQVPAEVTTTTAAAAPVQPVAPVAQAQALQPAFTG